MKKLLAALLALAMLLTACALAEENVGSELVPQSPESEPTPTPVPTPDPTPEPTPEPTPDPVEVARQALIAEVTDVWYLNEVVMDGTGYAPETFGVEMTLTLAEEGVATVDYGESRKGGEGTWDVQGERIIVVIGDDSKEFALTEDDDLTAEMDGGSMVLGREKTEKEPFEPAEPVEAELEQFAGMWKTAMIGVGGKFYDIALFGQNITAVIDDATIALDGYVFTGLSVQAVYADGALRFTGADDEGGMFDGVTAQLLADDSLRVELSAGAAGGFTLLMNRVDSLN